MTLPASLIDAYQPDSPFDELLHGQRRSSAWQPFLTALDALTPEALEQAVIEIRRRLKENGVTYTLHDAALGVKRAWLLDVVPAVFSESDWQLLETAVSQRFRLLDYILQDCYGDQALIKNGLLPYEVIYGHLGFSRAAVGVKPKLVMYGVDLARGSDGQFYILSDRTQAPAGMGYALENRTVMTGVLPQVFQRGAVRRLADFFRTFQQALSALSPRPGSAPTVVILSPGANSETYFEHAYLAAYLGYSLVQGDDLTVREGKVFLKTVEGLLQVDVILRRVDDGASDPLELQGESRVGVAGLLQATRRGTVGMANPIGSSLLENPGLQPFLPGIARAVFDESLILPSVATWWCGHAKERQYVLDNLSKLVIKRIARHNRQQTLFGPLLSQGELSAVAEQIAAAPYLFVGQEALSHASSPTYIDGRLEPRHTLLRCFAVAASDAVAVMPGGLSRSSATAESVIINNRSGGMSKDTWVVSQTPQPYISLWRSARDILERNQVALSSRAADNLFWVGRYAERAEGVARLLRTLYAQLSGFDGECEAIGGATAQRLCWLLTDVSMSQSGFSSEVAPLTELFSVTLDKTRSNSLADTLSRMLQAAFTVKHLWSSDTWRIIGALTERLQGERPNVTALQHALNDLMTLLLAFAGLNSENMSQELGWRFLDIGRRLERAILLGKLVRGGLSQVVSESAERQLLEALLVTSENIITYRRRYRSFLQVEYALELLLFDEHNPRSLGYQLRKLLMHQEALPMATLRLGLPAHARTVLEASSRLRLAEISTLAAVDGDKRPQLEALLNQIIALLSDYTVQLSRRFFSHTETGRQLNEETVPVVV